MKRTITIIGVVIVVVLAVFFIFKDKKLNDGDVSTMKDGNASQVLADRDGETSDVNEMSYELLECDLGRCPEITSTEVDGSYETRETLVYVPIGMTKGAGRFLIIQNGKLLFDTPAFANLDIEIPESGDDPNNGFTLTWWKSWEDLKNPVQGEAEFEYQDGGLKQVNGDSLTEWISDN